MIAALAAGAILAVVAGFAMGWVWDKRQGALSDVSILSVLTAFGTVGAVAFAAGLALYQRHKDEELRKQESVPIRYAVQPELIRLAHRLTGSYWIISNHLRGEIGWPRLSDYAIRELDALREAAELETCKAILDRLHRLPPEECQAVSLVLGNIHSCVQANQTAKTANSEDPSYDFFASDMIKKLKTYRAVCDYLRIALEHADFQGKRFTLQLLNDVAKHQYWLDK